MAKKKEAKEEQEDSSSLEELILNYSNPRYPVVAWAVQWAKVLEKKQEYQHMKRNEILELALQEYLSGKVTEPAITKAMEALQAQSNGEGENAEEETAKAKKDKKEEPEKEKAAASKKK